MNKRRAVSGEFDLTALYNKKMGAKGPAVTNRKLTDIFSRVGAQYGYTDVDAVFVGSLDMKMKWKRGHDWCTVEVPDYIDHAPDEALVDLATYLFKGFSGKRSDNIPGLDKYLRDPSFVASKRGVYLERNNLKDDSVGEFHDLRDSVDRLYAEGLLPEGPDFILCWNDSALSKASGSFRAQVIWVKSALDQKGVPEAVLDYCVYREVLHLALQRDPQPGNQQLYLRKIKQCPNAWFAEEWLSENRML